ncbi:MAG: hypothetical protein ABIO70_24125 [Pseudomonadota bacterium]
MPRPALLLFPLTALACKPPPPAPEGLQDSLTYLFRNFYAEDDVIGAGLTGFMDWVDTDGEELLGKKADMENVGEFTLDYLTPGDVAMLPIVSDVNLDFAPGTVALSELTCDWKEAEAYLVRTDQDVVFGEFETYSRDFLTPRATYEAATASEDFTPVGEPLADPYAAQPDLGELERSFLLTDNVASSTEVGVTLEFQLLLNLRHGIYEVQGEEAGAFLILTWMPQRAVSEGGDNSMEQSYSLELDVSRPGGKTLRLMASWLQIEGTFDHDDNVVKVVGVNKNLDSSIRLADICAGEEELPAE